MRLVRSHQGRGALAAAALTTLLVGSSFVAPIASASTRPPTTRGSSFVLSKAASTAIVSELNAVRRKFGLSPAVATHRYDSYVVAAAMGMRDPLLRSVPPGVVEQAGIWGAVASAAPNGPRSKTIVHSWVYLDGWLGPGATLNIDCTSAKAAGCNGHRDAILQKPPVRGATLSIDVASVNSLRWGQPTLSVAALLAWTLPNSR